MFSNSDLTGPLLAGKKLFLVEKPRSSEEQDSLRENLRAAIITIGVSRYDINPDKVSKQHLLSIWGGEAEVDEDISGYRLICQGLSRLRHGAVVVESAHRLSGESIQLFAQLVRHVEQHELNWRFIFIVNPEGENFSRLSLLSKDVHMIGAAGVTPGLTPLGGSKGNAHSASGSGLSQSKTSSGLVRNLALLGAAFVFGYLYINSSKPDAVVVEDARVFDQTKDQVNALVGKGSGSAGTELDDYLSMLTQKEQQFEQELQRIKSMNDSQAADRSPQPITRKPTNKLKPANKLLARTVIAMISTGDVTGLSALPAGSGAFEGRDSNGHSALITSVIVQQQQVAELLIQRGVSTEYVDGFGQTALYHAAIQGDLPMISTLIEGGANVNALTDLDKTPLMATVHNGHLEASKYLLSKGADVNLQDHSGWSALFYATWNSRDDIVFTLKTAGASDALRDNDGYSLTEILRYRPNVDD